MRLVGAALVYLGMLLPGNAARADDFFGEFQRICVATDARPAKALAVADKSGWNAAPENMARKFQDNPATRQLQERVRKTDANLLILFVGNGSLEVPDFSGRVCLISVLGGALPDLTQQAASFAGVPPQPGYRVEDTMYYWQETKGVHVPVLNPDTPVKGRIVRFLSVRRGDKSSSLGYGVAQH